MKRNSASRFSRPACPRAADTPGGRCPLAVASFREFLPRELGLCLLALVLPLSLAAAEVDLSKLPPSASTQVEFDRDIKPIFEGVCFKCHGAEKPKSKFSLITRESALKGGANGVDIIPGDSAKSPLIHYVARLVEDMEMPPPGKGEPLTKEQIALLRAWIDQGVVWSTADTAVAKGPQFSVSPTIRWISVSGNEQKFREHYWMKEGWSGGLENFSLQEKFGEDRTVTAEGRIIPNQNDYKLAITLEKNDLGFVRVGFEEFRKYFSDVGGYYAPFATNSFNLGRDLHLDTGKAWVEFGLTLPSWPKIVLGYEYQFKDGSKSLPQWGGVYDADADVTRLIYPAYKDIEERAHIIKLDVSHDIHGTLIEDNFRAEFYDQKTARYTVGNLNLGSTIPDSTVRLGESYNHFQAVNTLHGERQLTDWLFASAGYLYNHLGGDSAVDQQTYISSEPPKLITAPFSNAVVIERDGHVFNANLFLGPWQGLTFSAAVQGEWSRQRGFGRIYDEFVEFAPFFKEQTNSFDANLDKATFEEDFGLRYTKIPFTVLYADARFEQEDIGQREEELEANEGGQVFLRDTDATSDLKEYRVGFNVSPWQRVSLQAHYKHRSKDSDYDNPTDQLAGVSPGNGYSAFIRRRTIETDEMEAKLVLRPNAWLKTSLSFRQIATDFNTTTDSAKGFGPLVASPGGEIFAGNYDAHVYSVNATLTPWRRLYLATTLSYSDTRTSTPQNGVAAVVPYRGDVYSVVTSATYVLNQSTDLHASYSFSKADYGQNNEADGLPLGMVYDLHAMQVRVTRRFSKNVTTNLQYGFYNYEEPSSGTVNNYTAHGLFASLTWRIP